MTKAPHIPTPVRNKVLENSRCRNASSSAMFSPYRCRYQSRVECKKRPPSREFLLWHKIKIDYNIGIADLDDEKLGGQAVDFTALQRVHFVFLLGDSDTNDATPCLDSFSKREAELINRLHGLRGARWTGGSTSSTTSSPAADASGF